MWALLFIHIFEMVQLALETNTTTVIIYFSNVYNIEFLIENNRKELKFYFLD